MEIQYSICKKVRTETSSRKSSTLSHLLSTAHVMPLNCIQNEFVQKRGKKCIQRGIQVFMKVLSNKSSEPNTVHPKLNTVATLNTVAEVSHLMS